MINSSQKTELLARAKAKKFSLTEVEKMKPYQLVTP